MALRLTLTPRLMTVALLSLALLLGYASGPDPRQPGADRAFDGIEPHVEVGGLEAALAGCLAA
ncbi:exodeoxyribonuclease V subunit gamma, partial [Ideonella livida]